MATNQELAEFDAWDPMGEDYRSSRNTLAFNALKDPVTAITNKVRPVTNILGTSTICEHFAKYGECADKKYCDKVHIPPHAREALWAIQNTCESNKHRIIMNVTELTPLIIKLPQNAITLASVTLVKTPTNFYVTMPYHGLNLERCTNEELQFYIDRVSQTSDVKIKLQRSHEALAALFDHAYRKDNLNDDLYLSQVVACKLKDGCFRRASVIGLPDFSNDIFDYKLFLLDIGVEISLPRELIYDVGSGVLNEPTLALNCRLDAKPPGGEQMWSDDILTDFAFQVRHERFWLCKIIHYDKLEAQYTIDLLDLKTRESYTDMMLSKGFAEKITL